MNNTNRFLIVRNSPMGEPATEAYYASDTAEALKIATEQSHAGGRWLICVVIDEVSK